MRYCSNCSKELQYDIQFCPGCGASLQATARAPMASEPVYVEEKPVQKSHKDIIAIIIVLAILARQDFVTTQ